MDDATELTDRATDPLASDLVVACESAWRSIQANHRELPPVVMLLGTGVERGRLVKLGHWCEGRWLADGDLRGEVLLAGEALHLKPEDVFEVLLHEAAHGINAARGIKDTSRGGRYHNARFKKTAIEVGLTVEQVDPYGFAQTAVTPAAAERYAADIDRLESAMRIARRVPQSALKSEGGEQQTGPEQGAQGGGAEPDRAKVKPAECGCGRRMRMAPSVFAKGPVTCGVCGSEFVVEREAEQTKDQAAPPTADGAAQHPATTDAAMVQAEQLLTRAGRSTDGLDTILRLGAWRRLLDSTAERPIRVDDVHDVERWDQLARAVLTVDGRLSGPSIELQDGLEVRSGDRMIVSPSVEIEFPQDLPDPGTPGVVTSVRSSEGVAMVDFATAGVYAVAAGSVEAAALAYDYCRIDSTPDLRPTADTAMPELEADVGVEL